MVRWSGNSGHENILLIEFNNQDTPLVKVRFFVF